MILATNNGTSWEQMTGAPTPAGAPESLLQGGVSWEAMGGQAPEASFWDKAKAAYKRVSAATAPVQARAEAGLAQVGQEAKAVTNMFVGIPGGVAGVAMDAASRISDLSRGVPAKQAGRNARSVADQVNADWGKVTSALGVSQDASGSGIEHLMQKGLEYSDVGGAKAEEATGGVVSLETLQSARDTLLNSLGVRGMMPKGAGLKSGAKLAAELKGKPTLAQGRPLNPGEGATAALTAEQAIKDSKARVAQAATEAQTAALAEVAAGKAKAEMVDAVVKEALTKRHPLDEAFSKKKAEPEPGTSPQWDTMVRGLVEPPKMETPQGPDLTPKTRLAEPVVLGEAPDLAASGIAKLREGKLITTPEAKAIRALRPLAGQETIVGPNGKPYFQRGVADPSLLKVLGLMGLGAVAGTALYNWFQSPSELSGDNARDAGMGLAAAGAAGVIKGKGGMWHPKAAPTFAKRMQMNTHWEAVREAEATGMPVAPEIKALAVAEEAHNKWALGAVQNYLNRHAGTATDPIKDLQLPDGTRWEDLTDAGFSGTPAREYQSTPGRSAVAKAQRAFAEGAKPDEMIWDQNVLGVPKGGTLGDGIGVGRAHTALKTYLAHVSDYIQSRNLSPEKLQQYDLPRAIRETVANDQRIAEIALRDVVKPNPTRIADTEMLPVYKQYVPARSGARKFSFNKDGSLSQLSSVELPPGDVQYSWREIKKPDVLTPEQMKRIRRATEAEIDEVARGDSSLDAYELQEQGLFVAVDAKGNLLRDNFSKAPAAGDTPETAHLAGQLAQEGNALGHCVGGYCSNVLDGDSRIISLRDQHGRSYATVELQGNVVEQIKGPGNGAPADYVKPYVQDFVQSGEWESVRDLDHAGLVRDAYYGDYVTEQVFAKRSIPALEEQVADIERLKSQGGYGRRGWTLEEVTHNLETAQKELAAAHRRAGETGHADAKLLAAVAGGAAAAAYLMSDAPADDKLALAAMGMAGTLGIKGRFEGVPEPKVIEVLRAGGRESEAAAAHIYETTHRQLERSISQMGQNLPVEDIAQRVYEKAFRSLKLPTSDPRAFQGEAKISTFLHAIAKNETKNAWAAEKVRPQTESLTVDPETGAAAAPEKYTMQQSPEKYRSAQDEVATSQLAQKMQNALDKLPEDQRAVFDALEMEGLSYEEAAQTLNVPLGTIRSRFSRAKENLQSTLREYNTPGKPGHLQSGRVDEGLLRGAGTVAGGALLGAAFSDDPEKGAIIGGMLGLGGLALGTKAVDAALGRGTTRLMHIAPDLRRGLRDMELAASQEISAASDAITAFTKPAKKLGAADAAALDRAYVEADGPGMQALVARHPELAAGYTKVRGFLQGVESSLKGFGRFKDGLPDYLPLLVKDYKGLMATLDAPVREGLQNMLHKANVKMVKERGRELTDLERSMLLNDYLLKDPATSYQPGYAKSRRLRITDETRPFYHTMEDALIHYGHAAVSDIQTAKFFGKDLRTTETPGGKKFTNIENSIGALVNRALTDGTMSIEQAAEVKGILRARFVEGEMAPSGWLQDVRNVSGAALLGQIGSGLIQTSEALLSGYHHGVMPALDALGMVLTRRGIKPSEFGLANHVIEEVIGKRASGQLLSTLLKVNLLATLDQAGISQNLTASFLKNKALAQTPKGVAKLSEKWAADYGPDFPQLLQELQSSTRTSRTPLVDSLLYQELSDLRPTSRSEAPQLYNAHPNARMAYHLKQFMLTQADVLRRDAWDKIKTGEPKKVAVGLKNLALYATALATVTIPADTIKNWIMGRPLNLDKIDYVENFTRNFGLSRYTMDKTARSSSPGKTALEAAGSVVTPPAFSVGKTLAEGLSDPKKLVPFIPLGGRAYYNRELGGNEKARRAQAISDRLDKRDAMESRNPAAKVLRLRKEALRKERADAKLRSAK